MGNGAPMAVGMNYSNIHQERRETWIGLAVQRVQIEAEYK
jgi:hypothetical protein